MSGSFFDAFEKHLLIEKTISWVETLMLLTFPSCFFGGKNAISCRRLVTLMGGGERGDKGLASATLGCGCVGVTSLVSAISVVFNASKKTKTFFLLS